MRVIGYDGAAYRDEVTKEKDRYPVVTLVLYFGTNDRWGQKSRSLYDVVGTPDEEIGRFVHNYRANIFEIAWLDDDTVAKFKSDFRIIADYFVQMRKNHEYVPSKENIRHVEEVLNLLAAVSGDRRFEISQNEAEERKVTKMEDWLTRALDKATTKGMEQGIEKGINRGMARNLVKCVDSLMQNEGYSKERACRVLNFSVSEYEAAKKTLADETVLA